MVAIDTPRGERTYKNVPMSLCANYQHFSGKIEIYLITLIIEVTQSVSRFA